MVDWLFRDVGVAVTELGQKTRHSAASAVVHDSVSKQRHEVAPDHELELEVCQRLMQLEVFVLGILPACLADLIGR